MSNTPDTRIPSRHALINAHNLRVLGIAHTLTYRGSRVTSTPTTDAYPAPWPAPRDEMPVSRLTPAQVDIFGLPERIN